MTKHRTLRPWGLGKFGGEWGKRKETVLAIMETSYYKIQDMYILDVWVVDDSGKNEGR